MNYTLKDSSYLHVWTSRGEYSIVSNQLACEKAVDLDLHCFPNRR